MKALKQIVENKYITTRHSRFTGDLFDDYARFGIEIQDEVSQLFRKINALMANSLFMATTSIAA